MRGVSALAAALREARPDPSRVAVLVVWEPVIATDLGPPGRSVTAPLDGLEVRRLWDQELLASQSLVRRARREPERVPAAGPRIDEDTIIWDVVATWPPGVRWHDDMPLPEWHAFPVVDGRAELTERLARLR